MSQDLKQYSLFGAVTTTFPSRFRDASYTRRIPFNQEVFVDANRDESLVFEVNELNEDVADENGAKHFLKELNKKLYADANMEISEPAVQNCQLKKQIPNVFITTAVGKVQDISKRRQGREVQNFVKIYLANIRLKDPRYKTDVTITAYQPESTYSQAGRTDKQSGPSGEDMAKILREIISNFEVTDWSFFTEEP